MTEHQMNDPVEGEEEGFIDNDDPDSTDYIMKQRSVEIKQDMRLMDSRKRVSLILNSEAYREKLGQNVEQKKQQGPKYASED